MVLRMKKKGSSKGSRGKREEGGSEG